MSEMRTKLGALFWILAAFFTIWNLFGCAAYLMDKVTSDEVYAQAYGEAMLAVRDLYPIWATAAYAIAVWGGLLAAILFLMRRKLSVTLFIISLVAAVISFIPAFTMTELREASGETAWIMPVLVFGLGVVEILYSRKQAAIGVLN